MPTYDFTCEVCGTAKRAFRTVDQTPPRFCSRRCRDRGRVDTWAARRDQKWTITPEASDQIREVYKRATGNGEVQALVKRLGLPRWKITRWARTQGWVAKTAKERDWSESELTILERSAHRAPEVIQRHLKRAGFTRSCTGIVLKRRRMRFLQNLDGQSGRKLAECFGVDEHCIRRWIRLGYLKAMRRGTKRTDAQGGDIWFIRDQWVKDFVIGYVDEIDIRKVDKWWFVDLLANG